jgi:cystathionine beta-synthase
LIRTAPLLGWRRAIIALAGLYTTPAPLREATMKIYDSILDLIGNTPLVRLNSITRGIEATVLAKLESQNPGGSVKDRIGFRMVRDAERRGLLKPGGTIVEATSGNTGMGLALAASRLGYKMIFTMPDKMSQEKINLLKAFGAKVIVTPTAVDSDDPRSYYSVAKRLAKEIPGAIYPNQFANPENPKAHYETTGPELWNDTDGTIDVLVGGMGTGGTMSGASKFLKEKNPKIRSIAADPEGSIYCSMVKTGKPGPFKSYKIEGIGEDIIPATVDLSMIDDVITVPDKIAFQTARQLVREEGIFSGGSSGAAVHAALTVARTLEKGKVVVVIICDRGDRYLTKCFNDAWMEENQFLEETIQQTAFEILMAKRESPDRFTSCSPDAPVSEAIKLMRRSEISQVPVIDNGENVGVVEENRIIDLLIQKADVDRMLVREVMGAPLPEVDLYASVAQISGLLTRGVPAVLVRMSGVSYSIITKFDLLHARG